MLATVLALALAGAPTTIAEVWKSLPTQGDACGGSLSFDYGFEGGMRNFYCRAAQAMPWRTFVGIAPVKPFLSGPHKGSLDLANADQFGRYNPEFVRWATKALIPAANDAQLRKQTQPVYDQQVRLLARVYWLTWRVISADPKWLASERERYLKSIAEHEDVFGPTKDLYHEVLSSFPEGDPNLGRSATTWWLRRTVDETAPLWFEGLEKLLTTYDDAWLKKQRRAKMPAPPRRAP